MILRLVVILNGKDGTAVQAAKAHSAVIRYPERLAVAHFNSLNRTFFGAETAADAVILNSEVTCLAQLMVEAFVNAFALSSSLFSMKSPFAPERIFSITPSICTSPSRTSSATNAGSLRSKCGVQLSGIFTLYIASKTRPVLPL